MDEPNEHPLIREAIDFFGKSQARLAGAIGSSQSAVSRMLLRQIPVSAEAAVSIERATMHAVPRWKLRPDLWEKPAPPAHSTLSDVEAHV